MKIFMWLTRKFLNLCMISLVLFVVIISMFKLQEPLFLLNLRKNTRTPLKHIVRLLMLRKCTPRPFLGTAKLDLCDSNKAAPIVLPEVSSKLRNLENNRAWRKSLTGIYHHNEYWF